MSRAYVGLGANLGDPEASIRQALDLLRATPAIRVAAVSTLRWTDPVGVEDQPRFLNGAAALDTELSPQAVLGRLLEVEQELGRVRTLRNGPRTIDLDLLLYDDLELKVAGLELPHPRLHERCFALTPLHELDPALTVPGRGPVELLRARLHCD